eukprot:TRINITY_DN48129_c0_g1_i1.p1 TRINITY_DN48129_c0_g1~~TRINITY_DN48129_c0_g1_i1.p1  ORF type:complete len:415 (-),score=110.70 TRINITY_DN48129_c0_g1_i1:90-1334(-)
MRQEEFNILVIQVSIVAFLVYWWRHDIKRWCLARQKEWNEWNAEKKVAVQHKDEGDKDPGKGLRHRGRKNRERRVEPTAAQLKDMSVQKLLEAISSSSSGPPSEANHDLEVDNLGETGPDHASIKSTDFEVMDDVRAGKASQGVVDALTELSVELFGVSVWNVVSKKNRLRVAGGLHWTGASWEAQGLMLYRIMQQTMQLIYIGVEPTHRRQRVGKALVKCLREAARRDPLCQSIVALPAGDAAEAAAFLNAAGFRHCSEEACFRIDVRKVGKRQRNQQQFYESGQAALAAWKDLLAEAVQQFGAKPSPGAVVREEDPEEDADWHKVEKEWRNPAEDARTAEEEDEEEEPKFHAEGTRAEDEESQEEAAEEEEHEREVRLPARSSVPCSRPPARAVQQESAWMPTLRHLRAAEH